MVIFVTPEVMSEQAAKLVAALTRHPELWDRRVLDAVLRVPRDAFVPEAMQARAWDDCALPLREGATISQPYLVAFMSQSAAVGRGAKVLEVGTGSGYQAAILCHLGARVFSVEIDPDLAASAGRRLAGLGYGEVAVRVGDGCAGWPEEAPFDAIVVTAAVPRIPPALLAQLAVGGRLVVPLGGCEDQLLKVFVKADDGLKAEAQVPVRFVGLRTLH